MVEAYYNRLVSGNEFYKSFKLIPRLFLIASFMAFILSVDNSPSFISKRVLSMVIIVAKLIELSLSKPLSLTVIPTIKR